MEHSLLNGILRTILKSCKCITGCTTRRCNCRKNDKECSLGCDCKNCNNIPNAAKNAYTSDNLEIGDLAVEDVTRLRNCDEDIDDIFDLTFLNDDRNSDSTCSDVDCTTDIDY